MSLWSKLFLAKEVRDVSYAIQKLGEGPLGENFCFDEIAKAANETIRTHPDAVKSKVVLDGEPPLQVALDLIAALCGREIASGQFHTYRGVLSRRGTARKGLFLAVTRLMVERGYIEQDDADAGTKRLLEDIASAG